jgi:hypothetical protein
MGIEQIQSAKTRRYCPLFIQLESNGVTTTVQGLVLAHHSASFR